MKTYYQSYRFFKTIRLGLPCLVPLLTWLHVSDYTVIFGTLKDDSLKVNSLPLNYCFSHRNVFQNGVNTLSKMVNQFLSKSSKFCIVRTIRIYSNFTSMWSKYLSNNVWRDYRLPMSASAMVMYNIYTRSENHFLQ